MKINQVSPGLVQVHLNLEQGDTIEGATPLLASFKEEVTVQLVMDQGGFLITLQRKDEAAPAVAGPDVARKQPDVVYLNDTVTTAFEVLRQHPEGITSKRLAEILKVNHNVASGYVHRLRLPIPLVERLPGGRFRLTAIGAKVRIKSVDDRSAKRKNLQLGWDQWMTGK